MNRFLHPTSMGRGDPWPLSDIDVLPIYASNGEPARLVMQRHAELIDWWAASGRAQTLDVGWLAFTEDEVRRAVQSGPEGAAERMGDWRWFHGVDKAVGGRAAADPDRLAQAFLDWINAAGSPPRSSPPASNAGGSRPSPPIDRPPLPSPIMTRTPRAPTCVRPPERFEWC